MPPAARYPLWSDRVGRVEVRFVGRGAERTREATLAAVEPAAPPVAALRQVHSARVVRVDGGGSAGEGDALVTARAGLALSVITADCVPVLIALGAAAPASPPFTPAGAASSRAWCRRRSRSCARRRRRRAPMRHRPSPGSAPRSAPAATRSGPRSPSAVVAASGAEVAQPRARRQAAPRRARARSRCSSRAPASTTCGGSAPARAATPSCCGATAARAPRPAATSPSSGCAA